LQELYKKTTEAAAYVSSMDATALIVLYGGG